MTGIGAAAGIGECNDRGLAAREGQEPDEVSPLVVSSWAATRMLPLPPHPDGSMSSEQWSDTDDWRRERSRAVERIRHDLAELLREAGHEIPDADVRSLTRYSEGRRHRRTRPASRRRREPCRAR